MNGSNQYENLYLFIFWLLKNIICHRQKVTQASPHHLIKVVHAQRVIKKSKIDKAKEVEHLQIKKEKDHNLMNVVEVLKEAMTQFLSQRNSL